MSRTFKDIKSLKFLLNNMERHDEGVVKLTDIDAKFVFCFN